MGSKIQQVDKTTLQNLFSYHIKDNFNIDILVKSPGEQGCIFVKDGWYLYEVDDKCDVTYTGPFKEKAIIYAIAIKLNVSDSFKEYEFSGKDKQIYLHRHFHNIIF